VEGITARRFTLARPGLPAQAGWGLAGQAASRRDFGQAMRISGTNTHFSHFNVESERRGPTGLSKLPWLVGQAGRR